MVDMLDDTVCAIVEELNEKFTDFEFTAPHLINFEGFVAVNITRVSFRKARGPWIKLCNLWVSGGDLWLYICNDKYILIGKYDFVERVVREITQKTINEIAAMFYAHAWTTV